MRKHQLLFTQPLDTSNYLFSYLLCFSLHENKKSAFATDLASASKVLWYKGVTSLQVIQSQVSKEKQMSTAQMDEQTQWQDEQLEQVTKAGMGQVSVNLVSYLWDLQEHMPD